MVTTRRAAAAPRRRASSAADTADAAALSRKRARPVDPLASAAEPLPPPSPPPPPPPPPSPGALKTFEELRRHERWHYLADNPAIRSGYRAGYSLREALWSLFQVHNESFNVWSHGLGALSFAALLASFVAYELPAHVRADIAARLDAAAAAAGAAAERPLHARLTDALHLPLATPVPTWPLAVFMLSAVVCLSSSAAFHLLAVVDERYYVALAALDYSGIGILIFGSTFPMLWPLGFWCHPALGGAYLAVGSLLALGTVVISTAPAFRTADYRLVRMASFIATGSYGAIPFAHLLWLGEPLYEGALRHLLQMGGFYLVGALLYGYRVPERFVPGRLDLAVNSHNIFHLCVWAACVVHYHALFASYAWRVAHAACPARGL